MLQVLVYKLLKPVSFIRSISKSSTTKHTCFLCFLAFTELFDICQSILHFFKSARSENFLFLCREFSGSRYIYSRREPDKQCAKVKRELPTVQKPVARNMSQSAKCSIHVAKDKCYILALYLYCSLLTFQPVIFKQFRILLIAYREIKVYLYDIWRKISFSILWRQYTKLYNPLCTLKCSLAASQIS